MEAKMKPESEKEQKLTYDELNNACQQLFQQNQQLIKQLRETDMVNMFRRLDYLFKVVENRDSFSPQFVSSCVGEIQEAMTIKEEKEEEGK